MVPFVSVSQFLQRVDSRWVGMNLLDDGTRATAVQMTNVNTTAGATLYALLQDASEELMAAAAVGARYTEDEIRTYGGNLVLSIVSGLALGPVLERRVRAVTDTQRLSAMYDRAASRVEELRKGERIFWAVPNVPEAGVTEVADNTPVLGLECPNLVQESGRYFGATGACNGGTGCGEDGEGGCGNPYYPNPGPYPNG